MCPMSNCANYLTYGPIKINLVNIKQYKREPVYADKEKTHYLYTRHTLMVTGVVHPDSDINFGLINSTVNDVIDVDKLIQHFLSLPRQVLNYVIGGKLVIQSPKASSGDVVDCTNGPKPLSCVVNKINGMVSAHVEFAIQTDLNEAHMFGAPAYPILSNSYSMEHNIDHDFYTTRKIAGIAHFRSDLMYKNQLSPDDFRELLNLPSPLGFKRDIVKCRLHPDSMKLEYSFIDRETHFHIDNRPKDGKAKIPYPSGFGFKEVPWPNNKNVTRIEIRQSIVTATPTIPSMIGKGLKGMKAPEQGAGGLSSFLANASNAMNLISAACPVNMETLDISIYGNNFSDKKDLEYLALFIVEKRLPFDWLAGEYKFAIEEDVIGSFVHVHVSRMSSIAKFIRATISPTGAFDYKENLYDKNNSTLAESAIGSLNSPDRFRLNLENAHGKSFFSTDEDIDGVVIKTYKGGKLNDKLNDVIPISARSGTDQMRGTFLEQLFVEAIRHSPDEFPVDDHTKVVENYSGSNPHEVRLPNGG